MSFLKNISQSSSSDADLVKTYQQHRQLEILAELYQRYMELVYGVCLKYLPDSETARDAVMNIFEELVQKLPNHDVDNFRGWLYTVAKNHCLMQIRSRKNIKITELTTVVVQSDENLHLNGELEKEEHLQKMEQCLGTLPAEQKQCVELFYLQSKSYNEIVEATGFDWKQVRSFIQNGRRNLKICMDKTVLRNQMT
ncbi:MAG TPA: sigma-70 family RNA polymerase sigma factor [Chitinophagaceae bacterium]